VRNRSLPGGILPVLQTPFLEDGDLDEEGLLRLVEHAVDGGAAGVLYPAVASEVEYLSIPERERLVRLVFEAIDARVPLVVGASSNDPAITRRMGELARDLGASAWLVAVPEALYGEPGRVRPHFERVTAGLDLPLVIQDLQFDGPGLALETIAEMIEALPTIRGLKVETVPAGPKYTTVRELCGREFFIAGGWAAPQMIEALDRGVDAMIPEASMVRVYRAIYDAYMIGDRNEATSLLRSLLPILAFANQELRTSIAFFKRLLLRRGVIRSEAMRHPGFSWDHFNSRIADELIAYYLDLEERVARQRTSTLSP
jgi:4-hydroxy-tetrahydrodipicolinate synthase